MKPFMKPTAVLIIIATLFSLLLLGCRQEEGVGTVTAVAQQPTDTATISPTVTTSPTVRATGTRATTFPNTNSINSDTLEGIPGANPTRTIAPSSTTISLTSTSVNETAIPTNPAPLPTVAFQANVDYKLVQPSSEDLLNVARHVTEYEDTYRVERGWISSYLQVNTLITTDIDNFYPDPLPHAEELLEDSSLNSHYFSWLGPSAIHSRILKDAILQYFNQRQPELAPGRRLGTDHYTLTPYALNLALNGNLLWLLEVESSIYQTRIFLLLTQNGDRSYELIPSPMPKFTGRSYSDGWITDIILDKDFTGDGKPEIVIDSYTTGVGAGVSEIIFDVFTWNGNELIKLEQIRTPNYEDIQFKQAPDGSSEIHITNSHGGSFGCHWTLINIYRWPNGIAQHTLPDNEIPDTAVCNLSRAIDPFGKTWNHDENVQYPVLERAINQFRTNQESSPDLLAYALSQLAFAYLEQDLDEQAHEAIEQIYNLPDQSSYAQYLQQNDSTGSIIDLCRNLNANAQQALQTDIGNYLNENATIGRGFVESDPNKAVLCDLGYVAPSQVQKANLPSSVSPADALEALDLQLAFAQSVNLDDDPELEWIGILEPEAPWLVIFDAENNQWIAHFVDDIFDSPILDLKITQKLLTNNTNPSLLASIDRGASYSNTSNYQILLIDKTEQEYSIVASNSSYGKEPNLQELDLAFFEPDYPDFSLSSWERLEGFLEEPEYLSAYINSLTDSVLTQTDPNIASKITELLNYLPTDDPEAQPYREHLTYLLGYHHELIGAEEEAVSTYLDLIQQNPSSPWSWLAWARLQPE